MNKNTGKRAILLHRSLDLQYGTCWTVSIYDGGINFWNENNCIPESPVETLARSMEKPPWHSK